MNSHLAILQDVPQGPLMGGFVDTPTPGPGELLLEMKAVGINPGEQKRLDRNNGAQYPWIPGSDNTGIVVETGAGVNNFKKGDRVVTLQGSFSPSLGIRVGGLQKYSIAFADLSAKIPETVSFQEAATVPVTALTVSAAFHALGIQWPRIPRDKTSDEPILVWGGGSGVGRTAIAFLKLAGFDNIITTAAPKRTEDLLEIGARVVIDYRDDEVVRKLLIAKGTHPLLKAIDAVCKDGSVDCIAQVMNIGGKIACSLIPDRTDYDEHEIEAFFVQCLTFHDTSGENPHMRSLGEKVVWPFIQDLLNKGYPFQPQLVLDGSSTEIVNRVTHAFDIIRTLGSDGRKVVVTLDGQLDR